MAMFSKYRPSSRPRLRLLAAASAALSAPFTRIILLKLSLLSTTVSGNEKPTSYPEEENTCPFSDFLLNECGLCRSEVSVVRKRRPHLFERRSIHTAQQAVQLLRDSGLTEDQVRRSIKRGPGFLCSNPDRLLRPKIEFMKSLGLTAQDFGKVIAIGTRLLDSSLEKTLRPNIQYLQKLLGSEANVSKVFKLAPDIPAKTNGPEIWEKKLKHLASFGLLEDEIKELVRKHPYILSTSMEKVQKNMDFFMHTAGLPAKFLLSYPHFVSFYSLESRIKPRHNVLSAISAMQSSKRLRSLVSTLALSERKFLEKYVHCSPHAKKLLEIYRGKPALL